MFTCGIEAQRAFRQSVFSFIGVSWEAKQLAALTS